MKTNKIIIVVFSLVLFLISCKKRDMNVLPAETQNQSFGCLLNNKVWVNEGAMHFGQSGLAVSIYKNEFSILADKSNNTIHQEFNFYINQPLKVGLFYLNKSNCYASMNDVVTQCSFNTDSTLNTGTLEITKYDTVQKIVIGRFSFKALGYYYGGIDTIKKHKDSIITVTEGRFNIKYYTY